MKFSWLTGCILFLGIGAFAQSNFVYTNDNNSPNTVSAFQVAENGSLTLIPGSPFFTGGNGGGSDVDPQEITTVSAGANHFLYAANDGDGTISGFFINPQTGELARTLQPPVPAGNANGNFSLTSNPAGQFLFSTDEVLAGIHVFALSPVTGALSEIPGSPFAAGGSSQGLKVSPNGKFLIAGLKSSHAVETFAIATNGMLTPVGIFPASGLASAEEVNCKGNRVYNVNAGSTLIDAYALDDTGRLTPIHGSPFSNGASSGSFGLVLSPTGPFLFTGDGFGSEISSLSVEPGGGLLPVGGSPFPAAEWVSQVATTTNGRFVYAAMFADGGVDAHSASAAGVLGPVPGSPFSTGQSQLGVMTLTTFPAPSCAWRHGR
jgi:6-phosphogluconolactonase (cycloisomerase 2 family)